MGSSATARAENCAASWTPACAILTAERVRQIEAQAFAKVKRAAKNRLGAIKLETARRNRNSRRHPSSAFIYARVLERAIRSKVNDAPERTYQAGESWTEQPGDHHQVSANASTTAPAKLLAVLVLDTNDHQIVIPDK
jgi:quercetin dioxygenase-like cupin family protein